VVQVIEHILSPQLVELPCLYIGRLVANLILRANDALGPYTEKLLLAVLTKLQGSQTITLTESLSLTFARLINVDTALVIDFLARHKWVLGKAGGFEGMVVQRRLNLIPQCPGVLYADVAGGGAGLCWRLRHQSLLHGPEQGRRRVGGVSAALPHARSPK
jgi:hypothetical protein